MRVSFANPVKQQSQSNRGDSQQNRPSSQGYGASTASGSNAVGSTGFQSGDASGGIAESGESYNVCSRRGMLKEGIMGRPANPQHTERFGVDFALWLPSRDVEVSGCLVLHLLRVCINKAFCALGAFLVRGKLPSFVRGLEAGSCVCI